MVVDTCIDCGFIWLFTCGFNSVVYLFCFVGGLLFTYGAICV